MTTLFKNLLGQGSKDHEVTEEMRGILEEIRRERSRYEALIEGSQEATARLEQLAGPIEKAATDVAAVTARLAEYEERFQAMVKLSAHLETLEQRTETITHDHERAASEISGALTEVGTMRTAFDDIRERVDQALQLRDQLASFLEVDKPLQLLQGNADTIRTQVESTGEHMSRLREQHERLMDAHRLAMSKMEALDRRREEFSRDLSDKERRVSGVEQAVRGMDGVQQNVADVKREMGTLKAAADLVVQKTAALEAQRETIDRALAQSEALDRAMRQLDQRVQQQQENERRLGVIQEGVINLQSLQDTVLDRSREIAQLQRDADERAQATRQDLYSVQDEMKKTVERFDFERQSFESFSQRVADLRTTLAEYESRFKELNGPSRIVGDLKSQANALATQMQAIAGEVGRVDEDLTKLRAMRRELDQTGRAASDIGAQVLRIEQSRPLVESAVRDLEQLASTHARVADATEQAHNAHEQIVRMHQSQSEVRAWLASVEQSTAELREQVAALNRTTPAIEGAMRQAERVIESTSMIEARREFVDEMQRRMSELGALGARLDERGQQLHTRMEAAEQRFVSLGSQADEAERLSRTIGDVAATVREAEQKGAEIRGLVTATAARCEGVEALAEQARTLRQEIEQRQQAAARAAKDLDRATAVREEAAQSAEELDTLAKELATALSAAEQRSREVESVASRIEDRATGLRSVEERLEQFSERLASWSLVEQELSRSLEQITARQGTVEALQADLDRMVELAERTTGEVREITAAQHEVEKSHGLLKSVMSRLQEVRDTASSLDERKRQMAKAEERLSRAEALLADVSSTVEALQGQKALVDQAVEKAGSLQFLVKQAEAVIDGLREERNMTADVRAAMSSNREESDDDEAYDKAA